MEERIYLNGLEQFVRTDKFAEWIINYFINNEEDICFHGCRTLIYNINNNKYYSIELDGDDNCNMRFLIQDDKYENIHCFKVKEDLTDVKEVFEQALKEFEKLTLDVK